MAAIPSGGVDAPGLPAPFARLVEAAALQAIGQIPLINPTARIAVRILVLPVMLRTGTVPVAQVVGHFAGRTMAHLRERRVDGGLGGVGFGGQGQVDGGLGQVDAAFRLPDDLGGAEGGLGHEQGR